MGILVVNGVFKVTQESEKNPLERISTVYGSSLVFVSWTTALEDCFVLDDGKISFSMIDSVKKTPVWFFWNKIEQ